MSAENLPPKPPSTPKGRPAMIIGMIPIGAVLGFIGGLLIVIIVGLIARSAFSAEDPGRPGLAVARRPARAWRLDRWHRGADSVRPQRRLGGVIRPSPSGTLTAPAPMRSDDRVSAAKTKAFVAAGQRVRR